MKELETPRLHVRPLVSNDEAFYCGLYTDASVMRHIGPPLSPDAARTAFTKACRLNLDGEFRYRLWIMSRKEDRIDIGLLALIRDGDQAEIGAMLISGAQSRGFAAESIAVLIDYAFSRHDLTLLFTRHSRAHDLATGLMSKLAFVCVIPEDEADPGCRWELSRQQWQMQRQSRALRTPESSI